MPNPASRFSDKPLIQPTKAEVPPTTCHLPVSNTWTEQTKKFLSQKADPARPYSNTQGVNSDLSATFRHSGWAPFRRRVDKALERCHKVSNRRLTAFRCCGSDAHVEMRLVGGEYAIGGGPAGTPRYRIRSTKCHDRFCLPCSKARAERIRTSLAIWLKDRPNLKLITLTLRQGTDSLRTTLDRITRAFRCLRNTPLWKKAVAGGVATIEAKIGDDKNRFKTEEKPWNVHFHIIAEAKYIPQKLLSKLWLQITGDSDIVDIRLVGARSGAIQYITKYITKSSDNQIVNSPKHLDEAINAFTGRRLVSTFATWRGLKLMEIHDDIETASEKAAWQPLGSLDDFIRRAAGGDAEALRIMRTLISPRQLTEPRPPDRDDDTTPFSDSTKGVFE